MVGRQTSGTYFDDLVLPDTPKSAGNDKGMTALLLEAGLMPILRAHQSRDERD